VQLLGEPCAFVQGQWHRFLPDRRYQLLAYLAYTGEWLSREKLADIFWSTLTQQAARANLRKVFFKLKRLEWLTNFEHNEGAARWQVETDSAAFQRAIAQREWRKAVGLYRGQFLQGFTADDSEFNAWLEIERARLEELYQEALENYVLMLEQKGDFGAALSVVRKTLERDPLNETLHQTVMRLEFKRGNSEAALEQFERCRAILQKELRVEPLKETLELLQTIEQGGLTQAKYALLLKRPEAVLDAPATLFGRERLFNETLERLQKGEHVLLHGFGGMGKTALAATVVRRWLETSNTCVLWLQVGSDNPDTIFDALARPFDAQQDLAQAEDKTKALYNILQQYNLVQAKQKRQTISLLVLDDVWNAYSLSKVLDAVPTNLPVLVTSRQRYPKLTKLYVDRLERSASLELLAHYAVPPLTGLEAENFHLQNPRALPSEQRPGFSTSEEEPPVLGLQGTKSTSSVDPPSLPGWKSAIPDRESIPRISNLELLGGIKGGNQLCELLGDHAFAVRLAGLALREESTTVEGLLERVREAPHDLKVPSELKHEGRESVASLLNVSLEPLSDAEYEAFLTYGVLPTPSATPELLARCARRDVVEMENALFSLVQRGLAERVSRPGSDLVSYRVHDLAHSYAKANRLQRVSTFIRAALELLQNHKDDLDVLDTEIGNILSAAQAAKERGLETHLVSFMHLLTVEGTYYMARGHTTRSVELLKGATEVAEKKGRVEEAHYLYSKTGEYYLNFARKYNFAFANYQNARSLAQKNEQPKSRSSDIRFNGFCLLSLR
jgi:DNA-binding SARP family transcriptional activator